MAYARLTLAGAAEDLAAFYERVAVLVGRPVAHEVLLPVTVPEFTGLDGNGGTGGADENAADGADVVRIMTEHHDSHLLWVQEHLQHLSSHAGAIATPATHVAEQRRLPWWR
jgi:hypothetical protein